MSTDGPTSEVPPPRRHRRSRRSRGRHRRDPLFVRPFRAVRARPPSPAIAQRPAIEERPAGENRPLTGQQPTFEARPVIGARPAIEARPVIEARPAFGARPVIERPPAIEKRPATQKRPVAGRRPTLGKRTRFVGVLVLAGALAVPAAPSCASRNALAESGRPATDADDPGSYPDTGPAPRLTGAHACSGHSGFTCSTLSVPLDHKGRHPGTLALQVATSDNDDAPKGVLLFLTGGPGQPGVPSVTHVSERLSKLMRDYRLVMIDQRGTGEFGAVNCPKLQEQVGGSDAAVATPDAVAECAGVLGAKRDFFSTDQTIGDLESLRRALGVPTMAVDGVSYGSFTAARYAVAHPSAVSRLILDSVLPHVDPQHDDSLELVALRATTRVLRDACSVAPACGFDPADDLAWVVRHRTDPVTVFDALVGYEFSDPTYRDPNPYDLPAGHGDFIGALHAARNGDSSRLDTMLADEKPGGDDRTSLSSGLHIATVCSDPRFPWGDSRTPVARRQAALDRVEHRLTTADVWPFTPETAVGQGLVQQCLRWPPVRPASEPRTRMLPAVPTLILAGDRDLSTPLEWAQEEARYAPKGRLVVVKGAAHSIQNREDGTQGREAVYAFLEGEDG